MDATNPTPLSGCRILVVEDEYFLADDVTRALTDAGAVVVGPINETEAALRLVQGEANLHAAILDINVRGTMIYSVAGELRGRAVPFVFATGYDQAAIPSSYGDVPRWEKPFDPVALVRSIPALVGHGEPKAAA